MIILEMLFSESLHIKKLLLCLHKLKQIDIYDSLDSNEMSLIVY